MRRKRYLLFPLFFFLFCLPFCAEAQVGEKKLTVEFKNEELSSVFKQLSKISGYKILSIRSLLPLQQKVLPNRLKCIR